MSYDRNRLICHHRPGMRQEAGDQVMGRDGYPVSDSAATISPWTNEYDIPRRPITCIITLINTLANEGVYHGL